MGDTEPPAGPPGQDQTETTVLFMGDRGVGEELSSAVTNTEYPITVRQFTANAGIHRVLSAEFDCFVLTGEIEPDWTILSNIDAPIILYGDIESAQDRTKAQQTTDIILEQREPPDANLLLPTIRALTDRTTAQLSLGRAVDAVSTEGNTAAAFLVDETGNIRWSSTDLGSLLPAETARQLPETTSLYEQLAAVFQEPDGTPVTGPIRAETDEQLLATAVGGQVRYYRRYSYPVAEDGSERVELLQDVTPTVENYDRLALFEDLVENAEDGLFILNANWQVEYINQSYATLLGYEPEQLVGTHVAQQLSPGEMRRAQEETEQLIHGDKESAVIDLRLERDDGREVEAEVHFWLREAGSDEYAGMMGVVRDITERRERKRELERYETIIQALGDPVCAFDADGRFVYVNEAFEEQTGYYNETVRGKPATFVLSEEAVETARTLLCEMHTDETRTTETFEMELPTPDGHSIPTECQVALLPEENGQSQGAVAVLRDISRIKRREQRLSKFASVVSHDLRNPLDVALGRVEVLPDIVDLDPETETHLDEVYDSLKRMEQLIEDVLTITRQRDERIDLSAVSIEEVAHNAWSNVETSSATLTVVSNPEVRANRPRLLRIFENLFRNAVEHAGEEVTVEVGPIETDWREGQAGFYVADDGDGVPPDQHDQIFDDGFTTTSAGTGLGLTIVREIARAHEWAISLEEGSEGGARFEFTGVALAHDPPN